MTLPKGFRGSVVAAGLKSSAALDMALLKNDGPENFVAAVFTSNQIVAAPVLWSRQVVRDGQAAAVLLNSGGANACTGSEGFADTHRSAELVAQTSGVSASDVAICSTGLIGVRLPMPKIENGIGVLSSTLGSATLSDLARAIMTTDSKPKTSTRLVRGATFSGIAKGAGMLAPALATMLSVVITDSRVDPTTAREIFEDVCERTFNRIDSDGCTSTNDTVLFMSSGASEVLVTDDELRSVLTEICGDLAFQLIADAEGHSKIVKITTINAKSERDAVEIGRSCARNNLLKCALNGQDPNWGRVLAAIGTTRAVLDPNHISVRLNGIEVCRNSAPGDSRELVDMTAQVVEIVIDLGIGGASATILTNDLSAAYVHENSAYST
jgi:glutamate N-acetyltransferase/amino-acid N-acetyltransferase